MNKREKERERVEKENDGSSSFLFRQSNLGKRHSCLLRDEIP